MTTTKTRWLIVGPACLALCLALWPALWPAHVLAQDGQWQSHDEAGVTAYLQGDYAEAERQFAAAVRTAKGFGPQDPRLAQSLNGLAELYRVQGRYDDAERLHKRALAIREAAIGAEHPDVVQSLNNLAEVYRVQGRYAETESLRKRALAIEKKAAAQGGLWTRSMAAGVAAFQQGSYPEAEKQLAAAVKSAEGFGPQDLRSATSLNNLALLYDAQGRYAEAVPLYQRSRAIVEY